MYRFKGLKGDEELKDSKEKSELKGLKFHSKALAISALTGVSEEREEFCIFNRDGDGFICEKELKNALRNLDLNPNNVDINKIVDDAEIDGNGSVNRSELIKLTSQLEDFGNNIEVQDSIRAFDKLKNKFVSVDELKKEQNESNPVETQNAPENKMPLTKHVKKKQKFVKYASNEYTKYEAFITITIQAQPSTKIGCRLQEASHKESQEGSKEGATEIEEWKKRWRRNAAMRGSSKIFPKTWWMLAAKLEIYLHDKENIKLKLTAYYRLDD